MARNASKALRYATYSRCSSDDQAHKDFSTIDVQVALNEQYVGDACGTLAAAYKDEGISGTSLKRPGWQALLADAQAGKFDVVVATYMSRLGRGETFTVAEYLLKEAGVKVHLVKESFTDDLAGFVNKTMTRFVDGMYVEQVRMWTKTKMEAMVKAGYHCGGFPPFGYDKITAEEAVGSTKFGKEPPKRLVPNVDQAPFIREAFRLYAAQGSLAEVSKYLSTVTPRRWSTTTTKNLLTNEIFRGVQVFGQWRNDSAHEAIVDEETWQIVQERIGVAASRYVVRSHDHFVYYLRGRVICPHCGCPATQSRHNGRKGFVHYYVCQKANRREVCPVGRINAEKLHGSVLDYIKHASEHWTVMRRLISESAGWSTADEATLAVRGQLGKQKQAVEMRIANYVKVIGDGKVSDAIISALSKAEVERTSLVERIEAVDNEIASSTFKRPTTQQVQEAWSRIGEVWEVLTEDERADLLGSVVQKVEMTDKQNVTLELLPIPTSQSDWFALETPMGAGVSANNTCNPRRFREPMFLPTGGLLRKKVPRPYQDVVMIDHQ